MSDCFIQYIITLMHIGYYLNTTSDLKSDFIFKSDCSILQLDLHQRWLTAVVSTTATEGDLLIFVVC